MQERFFSVKKITRYQNSITESGYQTFDSYENTDYYLCFVQRGSLKIKSALSVYNLFEHSFIIYKPSGHQEIYSAPNSDYVHCVFSGKGTEEILSSINLCCEIIYPLVISYETAESYMRYNRKIEYILSEFNKKRPYYETVIPCMLVEFLAFCSNNIASEDDVRNIKCIRKVISYIWDNVLTDIDIDTLCEISHLSKSRLYALFKRYTGTSPLKFQNNHRIIAAADYLIIYNMKIKDVSELMGYKDPLYFSKLFKKYFGISPMEYIKKHK